MSKPSKSDGFLLLPAGAASLVADVWLTSPIRPMGKIDMQYDEGMEFT
jgi:HAMP domain-containing protein